MTRLCTEPECSRPHYGHGMCNMHWARWRPKKPRAPRTAKTVRNAKARARLRQTGWTSEQFDAAMTAQGGLCALCGKAFTSTRGGRPAADHDHKTGKARELLHSRCNLAVGQYEEFGEALRLYVERHDAKE